MSRPKPPPLDPSVFRHAMSGLLILNAVIHVSVALLAGTHGAAGEWRTPLYVFAAVNAALGVYVRSGGRTAVLLAMVVTAAALGLGIVQYADKGGPTGLPLMFGLDIMVLAAGAAWLVKTRAAKRG